MPNNGFPDLVAFCTVICRKIDIPVHVRTPKCHPPLFLQRHVMARKPVPSTKTCAKALRHVVNM